MTFNMANNWTVQSIVEMLHHKEIRDGATYVMQIWADTGNIHIIDKRTDCIHWFGNNDREVTRLVNWLST